MAAEEDEGSPSDRRPDAASFPSLLVLFFPSLCVMGFLLLLLSLGGDDGDSGPGRDSPGPAQEDPPAWPSLAPGDSSSYVLPRLEGVQVGHKQEVKLVPNKIHFMQTLSLKPLIFEIPDFLSEDECKILIHLAEQEGLYTSDTSNFQTNSWNMPDMDQMHVFNHQDHNKDGKLQVIEMMNFLLIANGLWLTPEDIQEMYAALKADPDGNGVLSLDEFKEVNLQDVYKYIEKRKANKRDLLRNSQQAWLFKGKGAHPIMHSIQQRVIHLTRLPTEIVEHSEHLQVVRYEQGGYYHAHWDSSLVHQDAGCLHTAVFGDSQFHSTCRYATVLFYLNNVTGGGETTFPIADNATYDFKSLTQNNMDLRDTRRHCDKGNLSIKPMQGTAIFWYNFLPDEEGWAGDLDPYSLHGGCLVTEGTKWIANNWINVDPNIWRQLLFLNDPHTNNADEEQSEWTMDKSSSDVCVGPS
ncbi:transmembrane prolyl 4-hydroxylase-like [Tiliqua scincoides]|uniref:transmembrane prolyl 4-hydroxylase-like n=1 Tax=Tiliqua scincoides TaxID=71010 RepID=UPI0034629C41